MAEEEASSAVVGIEDDVIDNDDEDDDDDRCYRSNKRMRPSLDKYYRVDDLSLHHVIATVLKEQRSFSRIDIAHLASVDTTCREAVPLIQRWLDIEFTPLKEPHYDYEQQLSIDPNRVEMMSAAMVSLGMDPGKLVQFLDGEYTGSRRQVKRTINAIREHVSKEDLKHIKRILLQGCPAKLTFTETAAEKRVIISSIIRKSWPRPLTRKRGTAI